MSLPHIIMGMLRNRPKSGYELKKELDFVIHYFWETDISRIYRTLQKMEQQGWVAFERVIQENNPNKKVYSLTEIGLEELQNWLAMPGLKSNGRNPFLAQIHFSSSTPTSDLLNILEVRANTMRENLQLLEERAVNHQIPIPFTPDTNQHPHFRKLLSLEYGIRRIRFELEWAEEMIELLRESNNNYDNDKNDGDVT